MKIEISEESFGFLKQFIQDVDSQDNRATAKPYFYVIRDTETVAAPEGHGDEIRYMWDGDVMTKESVEEHLREFDDTKTIQDLLDDGTIEEFDVMTQYITPENHNIFFTEKACHEHMESNHYHFRKPHSYIRHAWRNPEIEKLFEAVREIVKDVAVQES